MMSPKRFYIPVFFFFSFFCGLPDSDARILKCDKFAYDCDRDFASLTQKLTRNLKASVYQSLLENLPIDHLNSNAMAFEKVMRIGDVLACRN